MVLNIVWRGKSGMSIELSTLKRALSIRLIFEGVSGWATRELIEVIEDYLMERLPLILNNSLEPHGYEASVLDIDPCTILPDESVCRESIAVAVYEHGGSKPLFYAIYQWRKGDNTFVFELARIVQKE
jgi:hypothetical protein